MRFALDTNILISAASSNSDDNSPPKQIYNALKNGDYILVSCDKQLSELRRVAGYTKVRKHTKSDDVAKSINYIIATAVRVPANTFISQEADDPDDNFLIAMCESGCVDNLITGDEHAGLLRRGSIAGTKILTASQFAERYLGWYRQSIAGKMEDLINANGDHYTIQVAASFNRSALLKVSKNLFRHVRSVPDTELCGSYWIVTSYRAKSPWYFLVFGNYASRKWAMDDVAKLLGSLYFDPKENKLIDDEDIVTSKPYVRRISQVQADMHRVVN